MHPNPVEPNGPPSLTDESAMGLALELAREAGEAGEVPVGAVVVRDGRVLGRGRNAAIGQADPTAHAEIQALREAGRESANYRLTGTTVYCTAEPCLMCLGAMLHARIDRLVYAASDPKLGATERLEALRQAGADFNHRFAVLRGPLGDESAAILLEFFRERRSRGSE